MPKAETFMTQERLIYITSETRSMESRAVPQPHLSCCETSPSSVHLSSKHGKEDTIQAPTCSRMSGIAGNSVLQNLCTMSGTEPVTTLRLMLAVQKFKHMAENSNEISFCTPAQCGAQLPAAPTSNAAILSGIPRLNTMVQDSEHASYVTIAASQRPVHCVIRERA
jgi:hypothetical protein